VPPARYKFVLLLLRYIQLERIARQYFPVPPSPSLPRPLNAPHLLLSLRSRLPPACSDICIWWSLFRVPLLRGNYLTLLPPLESHFCFLHGRVFMRGHGGGDRYCRRRCV